MVDAVVVAVIGRQFSKGAQHPDPNWFAVAIERAEVKIWTAEAHTSIVILPVECLAIRHNHPQPAQRGCCADVLLTPSTVGYGGVTWLNRPTG